MSHPRLPRSYDDPKSLRPMLMEWAAHYYSTEDAQQTLVERTIVFAPDRLYAGNDNAPIEDVLATLMRDIVLDDGARETL